MSFKIWNDSDAGYNCHIEIDGEDVSANFSNLSITADIHSAVKIELETPIGELESPVGGAPRLMFPMAGTRELLIKHGWTPPAE